MSEFEDCMAFKDLRDALQHPCSACRLDQKHLLVCGQNFLTADMDDDLNLEMYKCVRFNQTTGLGVSVFPCDFSSAISWCGIMAESQLALFLTKDGQLGLADARDQQSRIRIVDQPGEAGSAAPQDACIWRDFLVLTQSTGAIQLLKPRDGKSLELQAEALLPGAVAAAVCRSQLFVATGSSVHVLALTRNLKQLRQKSFAGSGQTAVRLIALQVSASHLYLASQQSIVVCDRFSLAKLAELPQPTVKPEPEFKKLRVFQIRKCECVVALYHTKRLRIICLVLPACRLQLLVDRQKFPSEYLFARLDECVFDEAKQQLIVVGGPGMFAFSRISLKRD